MLRSSAGYINYVHALWAEGGQFWSSSIELNDRFPFLLFPSESSEQLVGALTEKFMVERDFASTK